MTPSQEGLLQPPAAATKASLRRMNSVSVDEPSDTSRAPFRMHIDLHSPEVSLPTLILDHEVIKNHSLTASISRITATNCPEACKVPAHAGCTHRQRVQLAKQALNFQDFYDSPLVTQPAAGRDFALAPPLPYLFRSADVKASSESARAWRASV